MAYATYEDVQVRWDHELSQEEQDLVEQRLEDVERRILDRIPDLASKIASGAIDVENVKTIEADAVLRLVRNPDGYIQETDGNYSYILSADQAGKLYIADEEWELLGWRRRKAAFVRPKIVMPR